MIPIPAEALRRQRIFDPCGFDAYDALFRAMSPVPTPTWTEPGSPPSLAYRADFDDRARNDRLRGERVIIKGRFMGGRIGYIFADELDLFAGAFRKELVGMTPTQHVVFDTLDREGPLSVGLIKEITGLLVKHITPALHALQHAFLVFEDQVDGDMERSFYILEKELPDADPRRYARAEALDRLLPRWVRLCYAADARMMRSLTSLPVGDLEASLGRLAGQGVLVQRGDGRYRCADAPAEDEPPLPGLLALDPSDFIVRAHQHLVSKAYGTGLLKLLLIDGALAGAVKGRFRFGPHDVEDILVDDPAAHRREEILALVAKSFPGSVLQRYRGEAL